MFGEMRCHTCLAELPATAVFCLQCGEPQTEAVQIINDLETCEIAWWRGFIMSEFYAIAIRQDGTVTQIYRSPSFRWRRNQPPPERRSALAARDTLVERLLLDKWETVGRGPHWYAVRFRRIRPTSWTTDLLDSDTNVLHETPSGTED